MAVGQQITLTFVADTFHEMRNTLLNALNDLGVQVAQIVDEPPSRARMRAPAPEAKAEAIGQMVPPCVDIASPEAKAEAIGQMVLAEIRPTQPAKEGDPTPPPTVTKKPRAAAKPKARVAEPVTGTDAPNPSTQFAPGYEPGGLYAPGYEPGGLNDLADKFVRGCGMGDGVIRLKAMLEKAGVARLSELKGDVLAQFRTDLIDHTPVPA